MTTEVYLVPAPLADFSGQASSTTISSIEDLNSVATENTYVMTPIFDQIVDPVVVLSAGPDLDILSSGSMSGFGDAEYAAQDEAA